MHDMNDKMNHQDLKSLSTQFIMTLSHQPLKNNIIIMITNLLVSVSVFSFMISNSAWCSLLLHHLNFYVVALPLQLLSHALGKGYIFLICNGILLIIAKTSSLVYSPSGPDFDDGLQPSSSAYKPEENASGEDDNEDEDEDEKQKKEGEEDEEILKEEEVGIDGSLSNVLEEDVDEIKLDASENDDEVFKEEHIATYILGDDYKVEKDLDDNDLCIIEDEDEENHENYENTLVADEDSSKGRGGGEEEQQQQQEEEKELKEMESMSTEELNKKFEDFIRKMKQELRIEAQQQLVAVK